MTRMSQPELLLALHLTELGVMFERQYAYVPGRGFRADFGLFLPGAAVVLVHIDGGVYNRRAHGSISGILADIERQNLATLNGYLALRFTPQQVENGEAIDLIQRLMEMSDAKGVLGK